MKKYFLLALILSGHYSFSQSIVSGFIKNEESKALTKATVSLLRAKDSVLVKTALTDTEGYYEFLNIKAGTYLISISSISYQKLFSHTFAVDAAKFQLPLLTLKKSTQLMNNVTVQTSRPFIESRPDKTIVNVEALPSNAGQLQWKF